MSSPESLQIFTVDEKQSEALQKENEELKLEIRNLEATMVIEKTIKENEINKMKEEKLQQEHQIK